MTNQRSRYVFKGFQPDRYLKNYLENQVISMTRYILNPRCMELFVEKLNPTEMYEIKIRFRYEGNVFVHKARGHNISRLMNTLSNQLFAVLFGNVEESEQLPRGLHAF